MAVYPGGYNDLKTARIRTILYIAGVVVVVGIVIIVGYKLLRGLVSKETPQTPPLTEMVSASADKAEGQTANLPVEPNVTTTVVSNAPVAATQQSPEANSVSGLIAQAMELLNSGQIGAGGPKVIEARNRLNEILPMAGGQERAFIKEQMAALAEKWLFGKLVYPEDKLCSGYKVNPGDLLVSIGKQHNVPYEILMQINNIAKPESLQAGVMIKVINGPFNVRVYRSSFTMDLYLQNTYVKSVPVGLGKPGMETPTGRWRVKSDGKLIQPIWTDPVTARTYHPEDPDYPLGSRWIALDGIEGAAVGRTGFAIHGTKNPEQIGTPGSQGCIRLHNGDVITVYNLLIPGVSLVDVVD